MSTRGQPQRATVLLATGDGALRARLAGVLAGGGFGVTEAAGADEALRRAAGERPQLVLLGAPLGDVLPAEVGRLLGADPATAGIPVLFLPGEDDPDIPNDQPPPPQADLVAHVRSLLRLHRAREEALREGDDYRTLFERHPHPLFVYDCQTLGCLAVNDAAVKQYGYAREEFLRMTIADLRPAEDVPPLMAMLAVSQPGPERRGVWRHRRKDGSLFDVEVTARAVPFGGRPACLVLADDVSERRRLEGQLLQAQKMEAVGRLAGGVAHDFNNLLTVVNGYAAMLLEDLGDRPDCAAHARAILKAGERAAALTQQLLAFGRKQIVATRVLDLNAVVTGAAGVIGRLIGEDVFLRLDLQPDLGRVRADPRQLEQVLLNLAVNARDAMPRGGQLTISTRDAPPNPAGAAARPGPYVLLTVADTGQGMTEEVRRHLFEPFFTTKQLGKGTGLGLATAYGIVAQAGGHIDVETGPGAGTTFRITLPRAADAELPGRPADPAPAPAARQTVLLAEDEDGVRSLARQVLVSAGYVVIEAGDGDEALRRAEVHPGRIDLLVSDVEMPGLGGRELAERLLARDPALKVLYLSGHTEDEVVRHGVSSAEVHFLPKPFSPAALAEKARQVLGAALSEGRGAPTPGDETIRVTTP